MRITLSLIIPLFAAACGQSVMPLGTLDAGYTPPDLAAGGAGGGGGGSGGVHDLGGIGDGGADTTGPSIVIDSPTVGSFVRGVFEIRADITDPSGVDETSVTAEFGNKASTSINLKRAGGDTFVGTFDVSALAPDYVLAEISVRAKDGVGNETQIGEEIVIDIVKPWMTMDSSRTMYVARTDTTNNMVECSRAFSPLGTDAAHEGEVVPQLVTLRARIEDHGNNAPGLALERVSLVNPATVQMFVIHDDGQTPLAVDTDHDTYCDEVNPELVPTAGPVVMQNEALSLQMVPLGGQGTADYRQQTGATVPPSCAEIGDSGTTTTPKPICTDTPLSYVVTYSNPAQPEIWTLPPVKMGDPIDCSGFQLDAANQLPEGPACVITRAVDNAGNVQVSFPLHICIDLGNHMCDTYSPTASHCTAVYDTTMMKIVPGSSCAEPPPPSPNKLDGPATFPATNDVEFVGP